MIEPRGATALKSCDERSVEPRGVQWSPPSVVRRMPSSGPPSPENELVVPMPATSVFALGSVGSSATAPIDRLAWKSVSGVHDGELDEAFVVFQTPPFTEPIQITLGSSGFTANELIAPDQGPSVCEKFEKSIPAGPFAVNVTGTTGLALTLGIGAMIPASSSADAARPTRRHLVRESRILPSAIPDRLRGPRSA